MRRPKAKDVPSTSLDERVLTAFTALEEAAFTRRVVIPLMRALEPKARIEETHGTNEAGRDLIFFSTHPYLNRPRILCIQVKSHRISTGSTTGPYSLVSIANQVEAAKTIGVVMPDGLRVKADEVWVINSHVFPEPQRRMVTELLEKITSLGGLLIDGAELLTLLRQRCPNLIAEIAALAAPELIRAIASLSAHQESRAFGLRIDRSWLEFHVSARAHPSTGRTAMLLDGQLDFPRYELVIRWTATGAEVDRLLLRGKTIDLSDLERSPELDDLSSFVTEFNVPTGWDTLIEREPTLKITRTYSIDVRRLDINTVKLTMPLRKRVVVSTIMPLSEIDISSDNGFGIVSEDRKRSPLLDELAAIPQTLAQKWIRWTKHVTELDSKQDHCHVTRKYVFDLGGIAKRARKELRAAFRLLPRNLSEAPDRVASAIQRVATTERFITRCMDLGTVDVRHSVQKFATREILVPDEIQLLKLGNRLLIEGPPGSGKTTLLRRLAIALLTEGRHVLFVPCASLRDTHLDTDLDVIARQLTPTGTPGDWRLRDSVLLIDGLDEAPFEFSSKLLVSNQEAPHIVATTRLAHETPIRSHFLRLEVTPFSDVDRDNFFAKWFVHDSARLRQARELIAQHRDIGIHTRTPLVATVLAALVERDYAPTTRNSVYNNRLELLLGRWHHAKGINQMPLPLDLRFRFLEHLAFQVHSNSQRRSTFSMDDMRIAFTAALGRKGRTLSIDQLTEDLVVRSGVLVQDHALFNFGHLTFQEHLVGRYLKDNCNARQVAGYLGREWWREALLFYAGERQNISDIIEVCEKSIGSGATYANQLLDMSRYAPYTDDIAIDVLLQAKKEVAPCRRADETEVDDEGVADGEDELTPTDESATND